MVADHEVAAVELAARRLSEALTAAAGETWLVDCERIETPDALAPAGDEGLLITSLLAEALDPARAWELVEADLWRRCRSLAEGRIVYLMTVFRHVSPLGDLAAARATRTRIRRLNLLAAELSRQTGLYVIDLDRAFADMGAVALETDYRLSGPRAMAAAALMIAETVLTTGLDALVPFEVQEAARPRLAPAEAPATMATNTLAVASGRRTQTASVIGRKEDQVGLYARRLLSGRMRLADVLRVASQAIARRGLWYCLALVGRETMRAVRSRAAPVGR